MIKNNLRVLLAIRKMKMTELARLSGISYETVFGIYHERNKRIDLNTLDKLCEALECSPNDIFEYVPNQPEKQ